MICPNDGMLRARLDNELTSKELEQVNQHLASCTQCRSQMDKLASDAARVHESLSTLTPRREQLPVDAISAYAGFRNQVTAETTSSASWLERLLAPRWRPAWGLIAVATMVGVFFGFSPARTWAQRILAMLRVQKIAVVSFDPSTLVANTEPDSRPYQLIDQFVSDNVVVTMDPGKTDVVPSVATASQLAGFHIRTLSNLGAPQRVQVNGEAAFQMNLNRDRIETLLDEIGRADIQIPESVNGALVAIHIPRTVLSMYGDCPTRQSYRTSRAQSSPGQEMAERRAERKMEHLSGANNLNCVYLIQAPSPTVSMPPDLHMADIAEAGLQLAGMSQSEAHAFCQTVDWSSTLVVPLPRNSSSYEKVKADGVEGTLITETLPQSNRYSLLWIRNGVIYSLMGRGDSSQALTLVASLK
jgi:hypothetical protein